MKTITKIILQTKGLTLIFALMFAFSHSVSAQCTVDATICTPGVSPAFGFTPTGGPYAGGSFVNAGCNTGQAGNHSYGFITLHITQSGPLNLLVNGNSNNGYIDVAVFDVPDGVAPCNAIQNPANVIGCNYAANSGGCVQFGNAFGCNSPVPAPFVTAGQEIMIIVQNYTNPGSSSFTLQLGPPPGAQTGPPDPTISPVAPVCISNAPFQLVSASLGGAWSGPGVSPTGVFNPAAAGVGTHTINYNIGSSPCAASDQVQITVEPLPTTNAGADVTICAGQSTTLTATGASTFNWNNGLGAGASHTVSPATTTTYTVTGGSAAGCISTDQVTVNVNPLPNVNAGANVTICQGASTTLTATGATSYTWNNGLGAGASHTVSPATTTTYTVTGTTNGCSNTSTVTVNVTPLNVTSSANVTICEGQSTTLTAGGATTYNWDNGLGAGASHSVSPTTTTTYTVTGSTGGCVNTASTTVTVTPLPNVVASADVAICAGETILISATGAASYNWNNGLGAGASHNVSPGVTTTYTVTGTTAGCTNTDQVQVTVNTVPTVNAGLDQIICEGQSVTLTAAGNADGYAWSGGVVDGVPFSPAATATYTLTGTNTTGCFATDQVQVTVNPLPTVNAGADVVVCQGQSVTLTGVGNAASYTWSGGVTNGVAFTPGVGSTTYTVTGMSGAGCIATDDVDVTVNPNPVVDAGVDFSVCIGSSVTLNGAGADSYVWTNGVLDGVAFTPAGTATYTVTGTDANGCEDTDQITVTVLPTAPINAGADQTICAGSSTTITATGGVTYTWDNGLGAGASHTVSPATPTTYTVNGTDANGCNGTDQVTINVNPLPTATINGNATVCQNVASPTITFTGANGTAPYTFTYTINGGANQTVTSAGATATVTAPTGTSGTFTYNLVSVQDASVTTCQQPQTGTVTIVVNPLPTAIVTGTVEVCQNGTAPTITFTGANGTAPYTFTYNINGGANQTMTSVGNSATVTAPTGTSGTITYNLVSVQDASSTTCQQPQTGTATVTVNPLPTATVTGTTAVCQNAPVPVITFTGANGTAPYTFTYNINGGANQTVLSAGATATVNVPTETVGTYTFNLVGVQDASVTACQQPQTGSATVTVIPLPTAVITGTTEVCQNSAAPSITFTGANGTAPYTFTYNINGGANQTVTSVGTTATVSVPTGTSGTFTYNLVSVQDASATTCSQAQTGLATVVINPLPTATVNGTAAVCVNDAAPTVTFTGANGTAPYTFTYNINGGANQTVTSVGNNATITIPTGTAGTYNVNLVAVTDATATACTQPQTGTATVTVNPNPVPVISGADEYCEGFSSNLNAGSGYINYAWSTGANTQTTSVTEADNPITVTVTTPQGCIGTSAPFTVIENVTIVTNYTFEICQGESLVIHGLAQNTSGLYSQTFVSATGCDSIANVNLIVNPLPNVTAGPDFAICSGQSTTLNGGGATSYVWNNGVTNGVPFTPAGTQTYTVTGTDANGCINTDDVVVTVNPLPTATIGGSAPVCQNDVGPEITFTGANSTAPYTFSYTLNGGPVQTVTSVGTTATVTAPTGAVGTFTYELISVQDASGTACSQAQTGTATITVNPVPTATISGTTDVCQNGTAPTITFTGANGTAPYTFTYNIDGGANQTVTSVGNVATITAPTGTAGTFTYNLVSVQDASVTTCSQAQTGTVTILVNPLPTATVAGATEVCQNGVGPTVTFTGANGTAPYTFTYNINGGANQTVTSVGNDATVTAPTGVVGDFVYNLVSVQDASSTSCVQAQVGSTTITVNPLPTATISGTVSVCENGTEPTITFTGANATAPYTFTYNMNGGANQTVTSVGNTATITAPTGTAGSFTYNLVSVQDASLTTCAQAQTGSVTITVNPLPTATIGGTTEVCQNAGSPAITFTGADGSAPYTFTYNINGGANQTVTSVGNTATVNAPTGTVGTFTYNLVSVQDASATTCIQAQTGSATVTVNPLPTATVTGNADVCINGPEPTVVFNGANGTAPYTFTYNINGGVGNTVISDGAGQATITLPTGIVGPYTVNLTNVQDASITTCESSLTSSILVTVHDLPNVFAGNDLVSCAGQTVLLTASGAVTYQWDNGVTQGVPFVPTDTTTYTVIGTNQYGCQNTDEVTVNVVPNPVVSFVADTLAGCSPLVVNFTNQSTGNLANCQWSFSNGNVVTGCGTVSQVFTQEGCYSVSLTATTVEGCSTSFTETDMICISPLPVADFYFSPDQPTTVNTNIQFINLSVNADYYNWSFGDGVSSNIFSPSHTYPEEPGMYDVTLIITNDAGCRDSITKSLNIKQEVIYYVPNAFTPDNDQYNEVFKPVFTQGFDPYNYNLLIFNRWGEVLFESNNAQVGWDGTYGGELVEDGVYIWKITFKDETTDRRESIVGHVTLIR